MSSTVSIDMAEANMDHHPTAGRRRRHKSPPALHAPFAIPAPQLDDQPDTENGPSDEDGEKEAKRQRSEPTTSTSSRLPYEYDLLMGITQVGSGEAEGSEEGVDPEYHDAIEDPNVLESEENKREADLSHGGCGSSSLRECIELLDQAVRNSPAASHSGPKLEKETGPPQVMSPNVEERQATAVQIPFEKTLGDLLTPKEESQGSSQQVKSEVSTPKLEPLPTDVKEEGEEFDTPGRSPDALREDMTGVAENYPHDSEDSLSQEHVASELRRLHELREDTFPEVSSPQNPE